VTKIKTTAYRVGAAGFALAIASLAAPAFAQDAAPPMPRPRARPSSSPVRASRAPNWNQPFLLPFSTMKSVRPAPPTFRTSWPSCRPWARTSAVPAPTFPTGGGVATVNLRNLGSSRTLVLINGRRTVGLPGSSSTDLNNIASELVDRRSGHGRRFGCLWFGSNLGRCQLRVEAQFRGLAIQARTLCQTRVTPAPIYFRFGRLQLC
jgi:hypothetical protein